MPGFPGGFVKGIPALLTSGGMEDACMQPSGKEIMTLFTSLGYWISTLLVNFK